MRSIGAVEDAVREIDHDEGPRNRDDGKCHDYKLHCNRRRKKKKTEDEDEDEDVAMRRKSSDAGPKRKGELRSYT